MDGTPPGSASSPPRAEVLGSGRAAWLASLPERIDELTRRWGLRLSEPFGPGGSGSWVAPGTDSDGREIVLKLTRRHTEALHEAEGLAMLGGQAAVEMYAFAHLAPMAGAGQGGDMTALVLERCRPGTQLRWRPEAEQHGVVIDLLRSVWSLALAPDHPFRPLSEMVDDWVSRAEALLIASPGRLDRGLAREGLALFRQLSRPRPTDVLLLTDLHAGNVLSAERRPWLVIDPKPYIGDPHYDVVQHLLNCGRSLEEDPIRLLAHVADLADLDAGRVRQWLLARCVQESLAEVPSWPGLHGVLRQLGDP